MKNTAFKVIVMVVGIVSFDGFMASLFVIDVYGESPVSIAVLITSTVLILASLGVAWLCKRSSGYKSMKEPKQMTLHCDEPNEALSYMIQKASRNGYSQIASKGAMRCFSCNLGLSKMQMAVFVPADDITPAEAKQWIKSNRFRFSARRNIQVLYIAYSARMPEIWKEQINTTVEMYLMYPNTYEVFASYDTETGCFMLQQNHSKYHYNACYNDISRLWNSLGE